MCLGRIDCQPERVWFIGARMSDADKKARLAEALRANLRRRKAQAREQRDEAAPQRDCTQDAADEPRS
jgi:hypothetical protein